MEQPLWKMQANPQLELAIWILDTSQSATELNRILCYWNELIHPKIWLTTSQNVLIVLHSTDTDYIMGCVAPSYSPLYKPGYVTNAPAAAAAKLKLEYPDATPWILCVQQQEIFGF